MHPKELAENGLTPLESTIFLTSLQVELFVLDKNKTPILDAAVTESDASRPGWVPRLSSQVLSGIVEMRNDPSVTADTPQQSEEAIKDFGTSLEAVPVKKDAEFTTLSNGNIQGPDGVVYENSLFDNPQFRKDVEDRSGRIVSEMNGEVIRFVQEVNAFPDKLEMKFSSQSVEEVQFLATRPEVKTVSDLIGAKIEDLAVSLRYLRGEWVGGSLEFKDPLVLENGHFTWKRELFDDNLRRVRMLPMQVISRILTQLGWFTSRMDAHLGMSELKKYSSPT
jgi:hypothetical protein